jgi:protein-tyrosine phosphatase
VTLLDRSPTEHHQRIRLFLEFAADAGRDDLPDPYYGGAQEFEDVLDLVEQASAGLVEELRRRRQG